MDAEEVKEDRLCLYKMIAGQEGFPVFDESENSARSYTALIVKALIQSPWKCKLWINQQETFQVGMLKDLLGICQVDLTLRGMRVSSSCPGVSDVVRSTH